MKIELLDYLACPACQGALRLEGADNPIEVRSGTLACCECQRSFPIIDGIPRFVHRDLHRKEVGTRDSFAFAWSHFGPGLSDNLNTEFLARLPEWTADDFKDKVVLDVGCGAGRLARSAAALGPRMVIAADFGDAIEVTARLSKHLPNIHPIQADLFHLPVKRKIDIAYSLGVIHHTPSVSAAFSSIVRHVRAGGRIGVWVYGREGNEIVGPLLNFFRVVTTRLPNIANFWLAKLLVKIEEACYWAFIQHLRHHRYAEYMKYFNEFMSSHDRHYLAFDFLSTPLVFYTSQEELRDIAIKANLQDANIIWYNGNGNTLTGVVANDVVGQSDSPKT